MKDDSIHDIVKILRKETKKWNTPIVSLMSQTERDPFKILIATVLSLRTKDEITAKAANKLFQVADNPYDMLKLKEEEIASLIYPVGFYRRKAKNIKEICKVLIEKYNGKVPDEIDELLKLPGVGRKTANLVVTLGYGKPGICVDTHVHRISNRLGYVNTKTPEETEFALREKLPKDYWIEINDLLVSLGQHICHPTSPKCSQCPIEKYCDKRDVKRSR
ncbi:DNA-(apurinic or apyrimidinic site) lyase [Desulfurobacterium thermolithotrophum DSM 11699]|uniref:Endonuclease III n=1 Tax=Desulfurobacterium thermolithotrophum (strain DSM 11699 / BSA) TaxID=868864 RepID=F0S2J2_DESTD|nr:endonuclease III [Desulfurobacterium thermolithotrophum]ADY73064.1 DNA-(apurinic or apyrimidinic site) lyase [Desulfurobacterium thermolithotrophum DSM 11699]